MKQITNFTIAILTSPVTRDIMSMPAVLAACMPCVGCVDNSMGTSDHRRIVDGVVLFLLGGHIWPTGIFF